MLDAELKQYQEDIKNLLSQSNEIWCKDEIAPIVWELVFYKNKKDKNVKMVLLYRSTYNIGTKVQSIRKNENGNYEKGLWSSPYHNGVPLKAIYKSIEFDYILCQRTVIPTKEDLKMLLSEINNIIVGPCIEESDAKVEAIRIRFDNLDGFNKYMSDENGYKKDLNEKYKVTGFKKLKFYLYLSPTNHQLYLLEGQLNYFWHDNIHVLPETIEYIISMSLHDNTYLRLSLPALKEMKDAIDEKNKEIEKIKEEIKYSVDTYDQLSDEVKFLIESNCFKLD